MHFLKLEEIQEATRLGCLVVSVCNLMISDGVFFWVQEGDFLGFLMLGEVPGRKLLRKS